MPSSRDRRRAQSGTTLIELLVSITIVGLSLALVIGTFSTGLLNGAMQKRNTAAQAVIQYEVDNITGGQFNSSASSYSECFATENPGAPLTLSGYQQACPNGSFAMRADVALTPKTSTLQQWTVTVVSWPGGGQIGSAISLYKANR
jgi:type II secretory pathway pseudopilin PulG